MLLGAGSWSAGALPFGVPDGVWAQRSRAQTVLGAAAAYTGLALLVIAWWRLGGLLRSGEPGGRRELRSVLWSWVLPLVPGPLLFSNDAYSYVAQGALAGRGWDVYRLGPPHTPSSIPTDRAAAGCAWRAPRTGPEYATGMALPGLVVTAPVVQPWYVLWGTVPLAAVAWRLLDDTRARLAVLGLIVIVLPSGTGPTWSYVLAAVTGPSAAVAALAAWGPLRLGAVPRLLLQERAWVRSAARTRRRARRGTGLSRPPVITKVGVVTAGSALGHVRVGFPASA